MSDSFLSGYQDLNLGPPAPKAGALPDCATSRKYFSPLVCGFEPGTLAPSAPCATGLRYIPKIFFSTR